MLIIPDILYNMDVWGITCHSKAKMFNYHESMLLWVYSSSYESHSFYVKQKDLAKKKKREREIGLEYLGWVYHIPCDYFI